MTVGPFTLPPSVGDERTVISGFWSRRLGLSVDWARTRGVPQGRASAHNNAATAPTERIRTAPPPASPLRCRAIFEGGSKDPPPRTDDEGGSNDAPPRTNATCAVRITRTALCP